jgi:hypothetical protein
MTLAAAKPVTRSALFAPGGLIVAGLLWLGSLYFVGRAATAYQTFGCATTAVETVGKTDTIVDVFFAREAFLLAHLWIVVAAWGLVGARTGPSRGWTIVLLIVSVRSCHGMPHPAAGARAGKKAGARRVQLDSVLSTASQAVAIVGPTGGAQWWGATRETSPLELRHGSGRTGWRREAGALRPYGPCLFSGEVGGACQRWGSSSSRRSTSHPAPSFRSTSVKYGSGGTPYCAQVRIRL